MDTTANETGKVIPMGTTSLSDALIGLPAPTEEEVETAEKANSGDIKAQAKQKLEEELKKAKNKDFAEPIINHLLSRIEESEALATDIIQKHKTWDKCFKYITEQARKHLHGSSGAVRDDVVYEWSEDYYHKDDKKEEEEKAKKEEERKKKEAERKAKADSEKSDKNLTKVTESKQEAKKDVKTKAVSKKKENDGQMDMFSFLAGLGGE